MVIDNPVITVIANILRIYKRISPVRFLQKPPHLSFRRKPEPRIVLKSWIPDRPPAFAGVARNDDLPLFSRVLQESPV